MTDTLEKPVETADGAALAAAPQEAPKRLFIKTYGCQMNVYDSERMADVLRPLGYATTDAPEGADFVILNTCHIREKAAEKRPDPLLKESASILADAVNLLEKDRPLSAQVLPQSSAPGLWAR